MSDTLTFTHVAIIVTVLALVLIGMVAIVMDIRRDNSIETFTDEYIADGHRAAERDAMLPQVPGWKGWRA